MDEEGKAKEMIKVALIEELEEILKMNLKPKQKVLLIEETLRDVKENMEMAWKNIWKNGS